MMKIRVSGISKLLNLGEHYIQQINLLSLDIRFQSSPTHRIAFGHSDPGLTLKVYAHLMPSSRERAREALDQALRPQDEEG